MQHYSRLTAKSNSKIKTTLQKKTEKAHSVEQATTLLVKDEKLKDPRNVASAFYNFFITITEKLNIQQTEKGAAISILKD
jgi:hypothetical protein